jgi:hypothetical protein
MHFTERLRARVRSGEITCSVRVWQGPRVKAGNRYGMDGGEIEVDSIDEIQLADITPALARESGFKSVVDLLKVAQHGHGTKVYLVRFHYLSSSATASSRAKRGARKRKPSSARPRKYVLDMIARLPEATAVAGHGTHLSLEVRKKRFGYFLDDHHGDGRVALNCKSTPDVSDALQQLAPEAFHRPKYLGNKGWVGLWLDGPKVPWSAVELALHEAYRLVAPKTLAQRA